MLMGHQSLRSEWRPLKPEIAPGMTVANPEKLSCGGLLKTFRSPVQKQESWIVWIPAYSHSIVAGGFELTS